MRKEIKKYFYFSKKFQGIGFMADFDAPIGMQEKTIVFQFKFLFVGWWIAIDYYK